MRVIFGTLGGRLIPFNHRKFGNARVTSDFVKEAVFGMLGPDLRGRQFLDLFAGSGQMGIEAVSRGATAWLNDRDRKRTAFITSLAEEWELRDQTSVTSLEWKGLLRNAERTKEAFDIVYVDPPYDGRTPEGDTIAEAAVLVISNSGLLSVGGLVFVQHDRKIGLPATIGTLEQTRARRYGDSMLTTYSAE